MSKGIFKIGVVDAHYIDIKIDDIEEQQIHDIFKDGRIFGLLAEPWIASKFKNMTKLNDGSAPYDFHMSVGKYGTLKIEHKIMNRNGIADLVPSYMKGKGRKFDRDDYESFVDSVDGFAITSLSDMPLLATGIISSSVLADLGYPKQVKRKDFELLVRRSKTNLEERATYNGRRVRRTTNRTEGALA